MKPQQIKQLHIFAAFLHCIFNSRRTLRIAALTLFATLCLAGPGDAFIAEHYFESGLPGGWSFSDAGAGDAFGTSTEQVHSGFYSAKCQIDDVETSEAFARIHKSISAQNRLYMRTWFYIDPAFYTSDYLTIKQFRYDWSNVMSLTIDSDMTLYLWNTPGGEAYGYGTGSTLTKGVWHSLEMMVDISAGEARLWLDGNLEIQATGRNIGANPINAVSVGIYWATPRTDANIVYIDDIILDTQYIGPGGELAVNPGTLNIAVGQEGTAGITGGTTPYSVLSLNPGVATAGLNGAILTVTGVSEGTTTVTITDDDGTSVDVTVNVSEPLVANPMILDLQPTQSGIITVGGGSGTYSAVSGNSSIATVSVSGDEVTVTGVSGGAITVDISDGAGRHVLVSVYVEQTITPGLGGCPAPPFTTAGVGPNVLLILDHSGSMGTGAGSKWETAKTVFKDIIDQNPNIRWGLMRLDSGSGRDGGKLLRPTGTPGLALKQYIDNMGAVDAEGYHASDDPQTSTNLAETLASAGLYFATVLEDDGMGGFQRVGKGPAAFGYYQKDYQYQGQYTNGYDPEPDDPWYDATTTDDYGVTIDSTSPIQYPCEPSFIIMLTDGETNNDGNWPLVTDVIGDADEDGHADDCKDGEAGCDHGGSSNYLDDVAFYLRNNDMRTDIQGEQTITSYFIGFGFDAGDDTSLLEDAAANGGGLFWRAENDYSVLSSVLQAAIQDILAKISSGTAVATTTTSSHTADYLYRAKFFPGSSWKGFLEKFSLPFSGGTLQWEAGAKLNATVAGGTHTARNIYTHMSSKSPKKQEFDDGLKDDLKEPSYWDVGDADEARDIINYIRGDTSDDGGKYKDRGGWLLGDIVYSTPVPVGPPGGWYSGTVLPEYAVYKNFKDTWSGRKQMVYVGANDGMLHAFDAVSGEEDWAFIPEKLLPKLDELTVADCHQYFVDLTPYIRDVYDESDGSWKTVLFGGNRFGGDEYFALDVTDPANMTSVAHETVLWDYAPFPGSKSSNIPVTGKVKANSGAVDHWVAVITSGYDTTSSAGQIAALKISDGGMAAIWDNGGSYDPSATTQSKGTLISDNNYYTMTPPEAVDSDGDGYLDLMYAGDTEGTLWKFFYDYVDDAWKKVALFKTEQQAITATPALAFDTEGRLRIYFGTGKFMEELDKIDDTWNAFYCVVEQKQYPGNANDGYYTAAPGSPLTISDLIELDNSKDTLAEYNDDANGLDDSKRATVVSTGWYFKLDDPGTNAGERVLSKALIMGGMVFFTSFAPNDDYCSFGGNARLYIVDYINAIGRTDIIKAGAISVTPRQADIGVGIPSMAVSWFDPDKGDPHVLIQKSDSDVSDVILHKEELGFGGRTLINSWRTLWW